MSTREQRRTPRKQADETIPVNDTIAGDNIGHIGNLSRSGMMLISRRAPVDEGIYQFRMYLPDGRGSGHTITVGVQEQWHVPAAVPGQFWAGFRILAIDENDARALDQWLTPQAAPVR